MPLVEQKLKIWSGRRWHAIFGFSMGGLGAIRYAAQCPGCFGTAGSLSAPLDIQDPSILSPCTAAHVFFRPIQGAQAADDPPCFDTWGNPVTEEFYWAGHNPLRLTGNLRHSRVYVAHGDEEQLIGAENSRFVEKAREDGVTVEFRLREGGHEPVLATADLADAIHRWGIFEPVDKNPLDWTFKTVSLHGGMWNLDYDFEQPPEEVIVFEWNGNVLSGEGSGTVTIRVNSGQASPRRYRSGCLCRPVAGPKPSGAGRLVSIQDYWLGARPISSGDRGTD